MQQQGIRAVRRFHEMVNCSRLKKKYLYCTVIIVATACFTLLQLPVSVLVHTARNDLTEISWQKARGTVWDGTLEGVRYLDYPIGTIHMKTRPVSLIKGRWENHITGGGKSVSFDGRVGVSARGSIFARDLDLHIDLSGFDIYDAFDIPMHGDFKVTIGHLLIHGQACRKADVHIWTDTLHHTLKRYGEDGFPLEGPGHCDDGPFRLNLAGGHERGEVEIDIEVDSLLDYEAKVSVLSGNAELRQALKLFGFDTQDGNLVMVQRGNVLIYP